MPSRTWSRNTSAAGATTDNRIARRPTAAPFWGPQRGEVPEVVDTYDERALRGVRHRGHRSWVDDNALKLVEVHPAGVGEHRLDHVGVRHRYPQRARPRVFGDGSVVAAYGIDRPALHSRYRLSSRELSSRRMLLHHLPERLLGELFERLAGPTPVSAFRECFVDDELGSGPHRVGNQASRLLATFEGARHDPARRQQCQSQPGCRGLRLTGLVEMNSRAPAGQDTGGVRRRPAVPDQQNSRHVSHPSGVGPGYSRYRVARGGSVKS
jgi:hypothetical protein